MKLKRKRKEIKLRLFQLERDGWVERSIGQRVNRFFFHGKIFILRRPVKIERRRLVNPS